MKGAIPFQYISAYFIPILVKYPRRICDMDARLPNSLKSLYFCIQIVEQTFPETLRIKKLIGVNKRGGGEEMVTLSDSVPSLYFKILDKFSNTMPIIKAPLLAGNLPYLNIYNEIVHRAPEATEI